ncbi:MAG: type II toxin-antitoxin system antitoxin SocA domain-containing protein [Vampirovibrionales bacterium]|nr:type II toxin-antitoxin system antitoxin SocA domain-containing protein [Vampirovibrionales bacterium]
MLSSIDVANYLLSLSDPEIGDVLTNLKLQKLVYYAQGFHLALYDEPLFDEPIVAWTHGPVVYSLYQRFKENGSQGIEKPELSDDSPFSNEQKELLNEIYQVYGQFSAWKLRNMTHEEKPWQETPPNGEISRQSMAEFFKTLVQCPIV